jgi:hypothetical protein
MLPIGAYLSNQLLTTLDDLSPPIWIPSLRHLSCPPKREKVVQRTSPSLVRRTLPVHAAADCQFSSHSRDTVHDINIAAAADTLCGNLTSEVGIGILVPARVQGAGEALEVDHR